MPDMPSERIWRWERRVYPQKISRDEPASLICPRSAPSRRCRAPTGCAGKRITAAPDGQVGAIQFSQLEPAAHIGLARNDGFAGIGDPVEDPGDCPAGPASEYIRAAVRKGNVGVADFVVDVDRRDRHGPAASVIQVTDASILRWATIGGSSGQYIGLRNGSPPDQKENCG
jgi:hypothetical protein